MYNDNEQPYVPQVGDTVRHEFWQENDTAQVRGLSERSMLLQRSNATTETAWARGPRWIKVETPTPLPERWINVYLNGHTAAHDKKATAEHFALANRLVILHVWTDIDGNDHAEIERVAL